MGAPTICAVVTCMGRLEFLRRTAPRWLEQPRARYCLVDYSCPDGCGAWLEEAFPQEVASGAACVERVRGRTLFNKSAAQNVGARRALATGAEYLCFVDADTLVAPDFLAWIERHVEPQRFLIAALNADGTDEMSLTGVLVLHRDAYETSGGFDEAFMGWGAEDIEYRIRLFMLHGLAFGDVPLSLLQPIAHDDSLRSRFYETKDIQLTNSRNMHRLRRKLWRNWTGRWKKDLSAAERLWFHAPGAERTGLRPWLAGVSRRL